MADAQLEGIWIEGVPSPTLECIWLETIISPIMESISIEMNDGEYEVISVPVTITSQTGGIWTYDGLSKGIRRTRRRS